MPHDYPFQEPGDVLFNFSEAVTTSKTFTITRIVYEGTGDFIIHVPQGYVLNMNYIVYGGASKQVELDFRFFAELASSVSRVFPFVLDITIPNSVGDINAILAENGIPDPEFGVKKYLYLSYTLIAPSIINRTAIDWKTENNVPPYEPLQLL